MDRQGRLEVMKLSSNGIMGLKCSPINRAAVRTSHSPTLIQFNHALQKGYSPSFKIYWKVRNVVNG